MCGRHPEHHDDEHRPSSGRVSLGRRLRSASRRPPPRAPEPITRPSTRRAFAKIEPTIEVSATTSSPAEREDDHEELRQVAERRLEHPRHAGPEALAELLGRERDDPCESSERDRREAEREQRGGMAVIGERGAAVTTAVAPMKIRVFLDSDRCLAGLGDGDHAAPRALTRRGVVERRDAPDRDLQRSWRPRARDHRDAGLRRQDAQRGGCRCGDLRVRRRDA